MIPENRLNAFFEVDVLFCFWLSFAIILNFKFLIKQIYEFLLDFKWQLKIPLFSLYLLYKKLNMSE